MKLKEWPDYTCVLTFIYEGLRQIGTEPNIKELASYLNIKVPKHISNPFNYELVDDSSMFGIQFDEVQEQLNAILEKFAPKYEFKIHLLNQIPFQLYEEFVIEALHLNYIVGFGYNYSKVIGKDDTFKHVSFIKKIGKSRVEVLDYFLDANGKSFTIHYDEFISAISNINDGFWIISRKDDKIHKLNLYNILHRARIIY